MKLMLQPLEKLFDQMIWSILYMDNTYPYHEIRFDTIERHQFFADGVNIRHNKQIFDTIVETKHTNDYYNGSYI